MSGRAPGPARLDPAAAFRHLSDDGEIGPFVRRWGPPELRPPVEGAFRALTRAIVHQQLAGAAAGAIQRRVEERLGGEVTPGRVLETSDEALRAAGLSRAKAAAIRDLAGRVARGETRLDGWEDLSDEEVVERLVHVRGIGPWTARMFLLFELRRPDVWPTGDLGVRTGYAALHRLQAAPSARELEALGDRFRPWRSAAAWYCWRALEDR